MSGNCFRLNLVKAVDKHSFNAKCIQLFGFGKGFKQVVEFLFGLIDDILLVQE
jgi:hypothetical protein